MEVFIERLCRQEDDQWNEKDLEQLRLLSRDPGQAQALWQNQSAFGQLCELSQVGARKAVANCLFHLPAARQTMARGTGGLLNGLLRDLPMMAQVRGEDDYVALRLLFLLTVETEGAQRLLKHGYDALLNISLITDGKEADLKRAGLIEILRILYNITRLEAMGTAGREDEGKISSLGAFICRGLGSSDGEVIGNTFNLLLNCPTCLLQTHRGMGGSRDDLADMLVRALGYVTEPERGTEYVLTASLVLTQLADADDALRGALRRRILPANFDRKSPIVEGESLKARLARLLGSPSDSTALATGDLLWALLRRNLPRLLYHMGYGLVAGFLYTKNLMAALPEALLPRTASTRSEGKGRERKDGRESTSKSSSNKSRETASRMEPSTDQASSRQDDRFPLSSDEEALEEAGGLTTIANWVTGESIETGAASNASPDGDPSMRLMTEEEGAEEAARLFDILKRLEDTQRDD